MLDGKKTAKILFTSFGGTEEGGGGGGRGVGLGVGFHACAPHFPTCLQGKNNTGSSFRITQVGLLSFDRF